MVIFFPTFGFTTAQVFIEAIFNSNSTDGESIRWDCVFLPDSGAFFVNVSFSCLVLFHSKVFHNF